MAANVYEGKNIRNVGIVGHGGSGKTSLVSAILFDTGAINRLGRVDDGNAPTDYDEDEIERKITISAKLAFCEWNKNKINILDTPGFGNFIQEARGALRVADGAVVVVDAVSGVMVQTEKSWAYADEFQLPRLVVVNRMDRDTASFERSLESIQQTLGRMCVPIQIPLGEEKGFKGVADLIQMKAYVYQNDASGKFSESDVPADAAARANEYREKLVEAVAESDEKLMEKFFDSGSLSNEELVAGLKKQVGEGKIYPVLYTSAIGNMGIQPLLNAILNLLPDATARGTVMGSKDVVRKIADNEPFSAFVFKTFSDPFTGRVSLFRVYSGTLTTELQPYNVNKSATERLGSIVLLQGKTQVVVQKVHAGDIAAVAKLKETQTGDTLCDKSHLITYPAVKWIEPVISFAIEPKSRGDEEKISTAIHKLMDEDLGLRYAREPQTAIEGCATTMLFISSLTAAVTYRWDLILRETDKGRINELALGPSVGLRRASTLCIDTCDASTFWFDAGASLEYVHWMNKHWGITAKFDVGAMTFLAYEGDPSRKWNGSTPVLPFGKFSIGVAF